MKKLKKLSILAIFAVFFAGVLFSFTMPITAFAATTPSLGLAASYGVLANTYTNSGAATTTVNGDVGFLVAPTVPPGGTHTNYGSGPPYATAGADQATLLTALNNQACTFTWAAAVELSADPLHGTVGVYTPGVYCGNAAMAVSGPITLNGSGTYIFRSVGAFDTAAGSVVTLAGGASACDIFWTSLGAATLGAGTSFQGTLIDNAAVTVGANTVWTGRTLAFDGPVTTGASSTITVPTCTPPPATLHIIKAIVNNDGGVATVSAFNLHVKLSGTDVAGSPAAGLASPGTSYSLTAGTYLVSEDANASYTQSFSGDCNSSGSVTLIAGGNMTCTITNDDIPPVPPAPATLHVIKTVINDNGGTAVAFDAIVHVKLGATDVAGSPQAGTGSPGTSYTLAAGAYTVSENVLAGYNATFSGDCGLSGTITLAAGTDKTCTITNDDIAVVIPPATINVVKIVINDNGRTKIVADFPLFVGATPVVSGVTNTFSAGSYTITETIDANYTQSFSVDCDASGLLSLIAGNNKLCVITNDDIAAAAVVSPASGGGGAGGIAAPVSPLPLIDVVKVLSPLALPTNPDPVAAIPLPAAGAQDPPPLTLPRTGSNSGLLGGILVLVLTALVVILKNAQSQYRAILFI